MPIRQLKEWWNSPPVKDEPSTPEKTKQSSPTTEKSQKRLDGELERKAKGKEADLEVKGYIKRVKDIGDS